MSFFLSNRLLKNIKFLNLNIKYFHKSSITNFPIDLTPEIIEGAITSIQYCTYDIDTTNLSPVAKKALLIAAENSKKVISFIDTDSAPTIVTCNQEKTQQMSGLITKEADKNFLFRRGASFINTVLEKNSVTTDNKTCFFFKCFLEKIKSKDD
jgi:hypothetical protein